MSLFSLIILVLPDLGAPAAVSMVLECVVILFLSGSRPTMKDVKKGRSLHDASCGSAVQASPACNIGF